MNERLNKEEYYLKIASDIASRSTCVRRKYGAVIVKDDKIISTGYNGSAIGVINCCDVNRCRRKELNIPSGTQYELCMSVHAEMNAVIQAGSDRCKGATLYLNGIDLEHINGMGSPIKNPKPCLLCSRVIINSGIEKVITPSETIYTYDLVCNENKELNDIFDL